jgi:hypothetical protein
LEDRTEDAGDDRALGPLLFKREVRGFFVDHANLAWEPAREGFDLPCAVIGQNDILVFDVNAVDLSALGHDENSRFCRVLVDMTRSAFRCRRASLVWQDE